MNGLFQEATEKLSKKIEEIKKEGHDKAFIEKQVKSLLEKAKRKFLMEAKKLAKIEKQKILQKSKYFEVPISIFIIYRRSVKNKLFWQTFVPFLYT